ncbi:MAG TPA: biotin carboxylase N-terminal domain-containing protein [Caulobacteraceae bacterium]|nr:biotin carboxylase N-terminal domain-containing protein [Caulobacteraceae bacterium]
MIRSLLIANRGEIAGRIVRTARRLGIRTVAVYSEADAAAAHVREADAAVAIGPPPARESYLKGEVIIAAARQTGAEAIHPGYGFLSENAAFAEQVMAQGLVWVGPPPAAIRAMGLKDAAKRLMAEAGVPVTPGYLGERQDAAALAGEAAAIGWPVLIKAVAGGGGKGMRRVDSAEAFAEALAGAKREAASAFGDDRVLLEKFVARPRHIEVQVFADSHGGVVHLFERDCSIQRRHQKVIEEAPAPDMDGTTRQALCAAAVRAARAVDYRGAGTVEFIADASEGLRADRIWFMEMNTRLQVEHPVTEAITGQDLVEWQLIVASGGALPLTQDEITISGHAIEARLYAEDPANGFLPSVGALRRFHLPSWLRVDAAVGEGDLVSPYYDPMLAKLISHQETRESATAELAAACAEVRAWPVKTNAWLLNRCLSHADFVAGEIDTGFIEARLEDLTAAPQPREGTTIAAAAAFALDGALKGAADPWTLGLGAFRLNRRAGAAMRLYCEGEAQDITLTGLTRRTVSGEIGGRMFVVGRLADGGYDVDGTLVFTADGGRGEKIVFDEGAALSFRLAGAAVAPSAGASDGAIRTPMPGRIVSVEVKVGEKVASDQILVTLEAMKMEHALKAPFAGVVVEVGVSEGDQVAEGVVAVRLEPADA